MARDALELRNELDYWRVMLEDLLEVNDALPAIADALTAGAVDVALAGAMLVSFQDSSRKTLDGLGDGLRRLRSVGERLGGMVDVVGGRVEQFRRELGDHEAGA